MVKVTFILKKTEYIGFKAIGHAGFSKKGEDVVCAGVSSCIIGGLNAIENIDSFDISITEGDVSCLLKENKEISEHDKIVLDTIKTQLLTIEKEYGKYIQYREERIG